MPTHLSITANGRPLALPKDFTLDIEDANPLFNDNEMYTYPVSLPIEGNRFLCENLDDIHADMRPVMLERTPMSIIVDGVPYRSGVAVVEESEEIKDQISFSIQSMRESLEDRISDLECTDIPLVDKLKIGEMIGDLNVTIAFEYEIHASFKEGNSDLKLVPNRDVPFYERIETQVPLQALGFSYPFEAEEVETSSPFDSPHVAKRGDNGPVRTRSFVNVSEGYPAKQYCNVRVCYKHNELDEQGNPTGRAITSGEYGPFYVLDADRPQTAPCFYVLYFFRCLFAHLGIMYDDSDLCKVEDLTRLFFFNTACKYTLERKYPDTGGTYDFRREEDINKWVSSRAKDPIFCGKVEVVPQEKKAINSLKVWGQVFEIGKTVEVNDPWKGKVKRTMTDCNIIMTRHRSSMTASVMNMYATSENFPKDSVSSIVDSMWNSFGVKFLMNYETRTVKAVLMRDVYRNTAAPLPFPCQVISVTRVSEKITGVRMRYAAESDEKEQRDNVKHGVRDYDTNFDYIDYSRVDMSLPYEQILQKRSNSDYTTYVDRATGNAYRLKVDADATTIEELNARLFEVGGYKGVAIGDCSPVSEDFVHDFEIPWAPMLFSDVNITNEMKVGGDQNTEVEDESHPGDYFEVGGLNHSYREQVLAAFLDEEMYPPGTTVRIDNAIGNDYGDAALREVLTTEESYDPSGTEDGNSPLQHADWGTAVAIMRGGGSDMTVQEYDQNYDGFGSSKWRTVAGKYASSTDSIDNWGNDFDYNGTEPGIGPDQRFSLKVRSYKNHPDTGEPMCDPSPRVKNRGLFDAFMSEHADFLLHRKKYKILCRCEITALADIPNHWDRRYTIAGITGWINRISTRVSLSDGLDIVEIELFSI